MKILVDTHCHTSVSHHAFNTFDEMTRRAAEIGLEALALTDHAPALGDGAHIWRFSSMGQLPRELYGVKILRGCEVNLMDKEGTLDVADQVMSTLDLVIVSMHSPCFTATTTADHTQAWMNVINNPYVDVLGHIGDENYRCDYEAVVEAAKQNNKIIEINSHSFNVRKGAKENCVEIARLCKKHGLNIVISSDAHSAHRLGDFKLAIEACHAVDLPEHLVLNTTFDKLITFLANKGVKTYKDWGK